MDTHTTYQAKQARIVQQLQLINQQGGTIAVAKRTSNLFRDRGQLQPTAKLDFKDLNQVIRVDPKKRIAEVEAATTYQDLVAATLPHGLVPALVPQFVTITVGGAVAGGACEASSFRYGAAHETVEEMTILLSDGQVITATPTNKYRDLFLAMPNTFGALGYMLKLTVKLVPAKPFVQLQHVHFTSAKKYFDTIAGIMKTDVYEGAYVDYLDGIITDEHNFYLTVARFVDKAPYTSNYTYMKIFYRSISERTTDYLTTHDFIWRWDADWAWGSKAFGMQNKALRLALGKVMLNSYSYWKVVGWDRKYKLGRKIGALKGKKRIPTERVVQDIEVPVADSAAFIKPLLRDVPIRPVWVCPIRSYSGLPFTFSPMDPKVYYSNFGIWGTAVLGDGHAANHHNRILETSVLPYHGHKALYSDSFYSPEEFWQLYDQKQYRALKAKYDPASRLKDFYQKVVRERV